MTSFNRTRSRGGFTPTNYLWHLYDQNGKYVGANTASTSQGVVETMRDVVSKPFVPGKTIVNSPMERTRTEQIRIGCTGSADLYYPGYTGIKHAEGSRVFDRTAALNSLAATLSNSDYNPLVNEASTAAIAAIKKPEVNGLVALAEFKETVHSLRHPIQGALNFLKRNAFGKAKRRKVGKRVADSAKDLADQHLTIVFGLMPFINDVQGTLKVLRERIETMHPERYTARGSASDLDFVTKSGSFVNYSSSNDRDEVFFTDEVRRTVSVRAFILYEVNLSLSDALGLSPSEIPRAVWQATSLSFVIDWFANVSQFIAALTPDPSIRVVTSGYTVNTVDVRSSFYDEKWTRFGSTGWTGACTGGQHIDLVINKIRVPTSLYGRQRLIFKHNMQKDYLDTFKVTAAISLLTQKLGKLV